jgi:Domain of unknown function (DUF4388)
MANDQTTINLDKSGTIVLPAELLKELGPDAIGKYKVIPAGGRMIYLVRVEEHGRDPAENTNQITLAGSLSNFGIADIFSVINMSQKTGVLTIAQNKIQKSIYFRSGEIVFASSNQPADRLGNVLYRTGKISKQNLDEAERSITPGMRFGTLLIKKQLINPKDLWWGVKYQIEEIIYGIFNLNGGVFYFIEGDYAEEDLVRFSINTQHLLMEGFRRMDELKLIYESIPSEKTVLALAPNPKRIKLNDTMSNILALIDGEKDVGELIRGAGLGAFNTFKILYQLLKARIIDVAHTPDEDVSPVSAEKKSVTEVVDDGDSSMRETIDKYNNLYRMIYAALSQQDVNMNVQDTLKSFFGELPDKHKQLFNDVAIGPDGTVDSNSLLANLENINLLQSGAFSKIAGLGDLFTAQLLLEGLNELLNFGIFSLKNALDSAEADQLIKKIRAEQQKLK